MLVTKSYSNYTIKVPTDTIIPVVYKNMSGFFVDVEKAKKQTKKMNLADSLQKNEKRYIEIIKEDSVQIKNFSENEQTYKRIILDKDKECNKKIAKVKTDNKLKNIFGDVITVFTTVATVVFSIALLVK